MPVLLTLDSGEAHEPQQNGRSPRLESLSNWSCSELGTQPLRLLPKRDSDSRLESPPSAVDTSPLSWLSARDSVLQQARGRDYSEYSAKSMPSRVQPVSYSPYENQNGTHHGVNGATRPPVTATS